MDKETLDKIHQSRANPHGMTILVFDLMFFGYAIFFVMRNWLVAEQHASFPVIVCVETLACALLYITLSPLWLPRFPGMTTQPSTTEWFKEYWKRNIVGKTLWMYEVQTSASNVIPTTFEMRYLICDRREILKANEARIGLRIPLGGWWRSKRTLFIFEKDTPPEAHTAWRASSDLLIESGSTKFRVKLTDEHSQTLEIDPHEFVRTVTFHSMRGGGYPAFAWETLLQRMDEDYRGSCQKNDRLEMNLRGVDEKLELARTELKTINDRYQSDITEIKAMHLDRFITSLDQTKRFIKSKEAQAIREWAIALAIETLPPKHPVRERYEQKNPAPAEAETGT